MSSLTLQYTAAARTHRGRRRPSNEDAFGYSVEDGVFVVCDGMGGAAGGEVASALAVEQVLRLLTEFREALRGEPGVVTRLAAEAVPEAIVEAIAQANAAIHTRAQRSLRLSGMGTTLVALVADGTRLLVVNIGDSRCYQLRGRTLRVCTEDHSLIEEQIRMGRMTRDEAARSPLRHIITRALGTQSQVTPDVFALDPEPGDLYLLCSDGLTRELSEERIAEILREPGSLDERCEVLVEAANRAGGQDNITCLLLAVAEA